MRSIHLFLIGLAIGLLSCMSARSPGQIGAESLRGTVIITVWQDEERTQYMGTGSGYVADRSGLVVSADHVTRFGYLTVTYFGGPTVNAERISRDKENDISLVMPVIPLGNLCMSSSEAPPSIGDTAIAVGNPYDLGLNFQVGYVTSTEHVYNDTTVFRMSSLVIHGYSGGPVVDMSGKVIGIADMTLPTPYGYGGISWAVPVEKANDLIENELGRPPAC